MRTPDAPSEQLKIIPAVEVPLGAGARDMRCEEGPRAFRHAQEVRLRRRGIVLDWRYMPGELCAGTSPLEVVARAGRWAMA